MSRLIRPASLAVAVTAFATVLPGGGAQAATLPTLYVQYTVGCTYTIVGDNGNAIGATIPSGTYQVDVTTPFPFAEGDEADTPPSCPNIMFSMTGPGLTLYTDLQQGDRAEEVLTAILQPNATYTADDGNAAAATRRTIATSSATAGAPATTTTATTGGATTGKGAGSSTNDVVGSAILQPRGALSGSVSVAGKLTLTFKGKAVGTLKAGSYKVNVSDKDKKAGLQLQKLYKNPITDTVTTPAFVGTKTATVKLVAGQWVFLTPGGAKNYFLVVA